MAPARTSTITIVVASHSKVPSDSGVGVGTVYAATSMPSTGGPSVELRRASVAGAEGSFGRRRGLSTFIGAVGTSREGEHLRCHRAGAVLDHPAGIGIAVQERLHEALGLLEGDV